MRWISFLFVAVLAFHGSLTPSEGREPYVPQYLDPIRESWRWQFFPQLREKGLECLTEYPEGVMWFGVAEGAIRYNGRTWESYGPEEGLTSSPVFHLGVVPEQGLFAATPGGLFHFENDRWTRSFPEGSEQIPVTTFLSTRKRQLWIGTPDGLYIKDNTQTYYLTNKTSAQTSRVLPENIRQIQLSDSLLQIDGATRTVELILYVNSLLEARDGSIWIGQWDGILLRYDPSRGNLDNPSAWQRYGSEEGVSIGLRPFLFEDHDSIIWTCNDSVSGFLSRFDGQQWSQYRLSDRGAADTMVNIIQTRDEKLWICGFDLVVKDGPKWQVYQAGNYPLPALRNMIFESSDGALWIAGRHHQAVRIGYMTPRWTSYNNLNFFFDRPDGSSWFITREGRVVTRRNQEWESYGPEDGLMSNPTGLFETSHGCLLAVGSHNQTSAVSFLVDGEWKTQTFEGLSWGIDARSCYEDRQNRIWMSASVDSLSDLGQKGGILCYSPDPRNGICNGSWTKYSGPQYPNFAYGIGESDDGAIWVGGTRMYCFKDGQWFPPELPTGLKGVAVDVVYTNNEGELWIGSRDNGIFILRQGVWKQYSVRDGLADVTILDIVEDREGFTWVATPRGVSCFDGHTWTTHALPSEIVPNPRRGNLSLGLDDAIWLNQASASWHRSGYPYTSTTELEAYEFWCLRFKRSTEPPETQITSALDKVSYPGNTLIEWDGYDTWQKTDDRYMQYSYRLDKGKWSPFSQDRKTTYLELPSGVHQFEVRSRNMDRMVDPTPAAITFEVLPPMWKEPWFLVTSGLILLILVGQAIRLAINHNLMKAANQALESANQRLQDEIEERRKIDEALLQSRERYRSLVRNLPVAVWTISHSGQTLFITPNVEQITGYTAEEVMEKGPEFWKNIHPDDQGEIGTSWAHAFEKQKEFWVECRLRRKQGDYLWVHLHANLPYTRDGIQCVDGTLADISQRKATEEALRQREAQYSAIFTMANDAFLIMTPEGKIVDANPQACHLYGYTHEEITQLSGKDIVAPEKHTVFSSALEKIQEHGTVRVESVDRRKDGSTFHVEVNGSQIIYNNQPHILSVVRDITERLQAEKERQELESKVRQTQKLESLGILAGGIAHDFNNLLMGILGNAGLALMDLAESSPAYESIKNIEITTRRASELTNQMLAYSGKGQFVIQPIDLTELVEEMVRLLESSISKKAVLNCLFQADLPKIEADTAQIRQVVMNLVINASESLPDGQGSIQIITSTLDADEDVLSQYFLGDVLSPGLYVCLEVSDTGCGMDHETLSRIFDPFFTTKFTGRGLGMAAVLGIIRGHKGAIRVYSEPGKGSSFRILFPPSNKQIIPAVVPETVNLDTYRDILILVADDEPAVRDVTERILSRAGFRVITAENGVRAVELFKQHQKEIGMVLLDLTMPGLDGLEVFHEVRKVDTHIPVILSSGFSEQESVKRFMSEGLAGFLQKPYSTSDLIRKISMVLHGG